MDEQYGWICEYLYGSVVFKKIKIKKNNKKKLLQLCITRQTTLKATD